jgi:hypothetical protein
MSTAAESMYSPPDSMKHTAIATVLALALPAAPAGDRQLFNGKDLDLWRHVGNGHFTEISVRALRPK